MPPPDLLNFEQRDDTQQPRCAQWWPSILTICSACLICFGCRTSADHPTYLGEAELNHYKQQATEIDYPQASDPPSSTAWDTKAPHRLRNIDRDDIWDLTLEDALHIALTNSKIIKTRGQFLQSGASLLAGNATVYDNAIQETGSLLGSRGVEAALADFDAQFTTTATWGSNEQVQNNLFQSGGLAAGRTLSQETALVNATLQKQFAFGGNVALSHEWNYSLNNAPARLFGSTYTGSLRADYRQPLWAGAGTEFTRIAGPIGQSVQGVSGVSQGVLIARINSDMSIAEFEANVRNMLKDVEDIYWDLNLAYHAWDREVVARNNALFLWKRIKNGPDPTAVDEAQALENYHDRRARAEIALADLFELESQLRRLLSLPVNDGRIIRPFDEPLAAEYIPDWHSALAESLTRRVELRRQEWEIKSLALQLKAAKKLTRPRFDFVSGYQVNGFGDQLLGQNDNDGATSQGLNSAYETLTQGDQTGWDLGFEFSVPVGLRAARGQQANYEHRLSRAKALLASQELEVSHELANAFQTLDRWYLQSKAQFQRRQAAQRRVDAYQALFDAGLDRGSGQNRSQNILDLFIRSQESLAEADIAFHRSLTEYNKAISNLHFRKGTLLEHNGVHLAEGNWKPGAYKDALRRAWARSFAFDANYLKTKPAEVEMTAGIGPSNDEQLEHDQFYQADTEQDTNGNEPIQRDEAEQDRSDHDVRQPDLPPEPTSFLEDDSVLIQASDWQIAPFDDSFEASAQTAAQEDWNSIEVDSQAAELNDSFNR